MEKTFTKEEIFILGKPGIGKSYITELIKKLSKEKK
jgi:DNA replication protein DnaC